MPMVFLFIFNVKEKVIRSDLIKEEGTKLASFLQNKDSSIKNNPSSPLTSFVKHESHFDGFESFQNFAPNF